MNNQAVQLLKDGKILIHRTCPVLTLKRDENGEVIRYKVRLVVQGFTMRKGIDYDRTYSLCVRLITIRMEAVMAAQNDWILWNVDVPNAYLNGICPKLVLVELPKHWNRFAGNEIANDGEPSIMDNSLYWHSRCWSKLE